MKGYSVQGNRLLVRHLIRGDRCIDYDNQRITGRGMFAYVSLLSSFTLFLTSYTGRNRDWTRGRVLYHRRSR
jgi:hypothetical protein